MSNAPFTRNQGSSTVLDSAISAWKADPPEDEALSGFARARILARAADTRPSRPLRAVFFPFKRLALAGALPLLVLTAMIGYLALGEFRTAPGATHAPIFASKTGSEVVFTIANGNRPHRVYLSSVPDRFESAPALLTHDGVFRDRLSGGSDLVFYRID